MAFNLAIIGMGGMANWHYKNISNFDFVNIVGAYDIREAAQEDIKSKGIKLYANPEELYADKSVDVVLIATPNNFHRPYAIACLESGKNVISEKPVTLNAAELEEVLAVAKKTNKFFTVHQNRRWDTDFLTMRGVIENKLLGAPHVIESRVQGSRGMIHGWRCFKTHGGGMVLDWGVHLIDQMLDFIREPLVEVDAHLHNVISDEVDDVFTATFRFESGLSYLVNVSMNCFIQQPRWHVCSSGGSMMIEDWDANGKLLKNKSNEELEWADTIIYTSAGPTRSMAPRPKHTIEEVELPIVKQDCFLTYYSNIDEVLAGKADILVKPEQMQRVMKVIDLVFLSNEQKVGLSCNL